MRAFLVLASIFLELHLHLTGSQAEHQRSSSTDNEVAPLKGSEDKSEDVIEGPIREVLAQSGSNANLLCKISDPGAGTVEKRMVPKNRCIEHEFNCLLENITWVKRRDRQLLTVGTSTYSIDKRFVAMHSNTDWTLQIRAVTVQDAGIYECQVASHPVQRYFVRLNITEAYSIIHGAPDLHVKQGSSLRLECQLMAAAESPFYVFWYRQGHMINYDAEPGVNVELTKSGSILMVEKTKPYHGGNYTCTPSNARAANVIVHVIEEEEKPAAMHGGDRRNLSPAILASNCLVSLLAAVSWRIPNFTSLYPT